MNGYAQLAHVKADIAGVTGSSVLDDTLVRAIDEVSREFDNETRRIFYSETAVRYFDQDVASDGSLYLQKDILAASALKIDVAGAGTYTATLAANTDYWLYPDNSTQARRRIDLNPLSTQYATWPTGRRRIQVTGEFGYSNETEATGQTVQDAVQIAAGATTLTVTSTDDISVGETLVIGTEQLYVSAKTPTTLTVQRGINGTTDALHANGVAVYRRRYPRDIEMVVKERVVGLRWDAQSGYMGSATLIGDAVGAASSTQARATFARWMACIKRYRIPVFA